MMSPHRQVVTVGKLRIYTVLGFAFAFLLLSALQIGRIQDQRSQCERANNARVSELHQRTDLVQINRNRVQADLAAGDMESAQANRAAVRRYSERRDELIASMSDVAVEPGSVVADCSDVYPYSFPVSLFD